VAKILSTDKIDLALDADGDLAIVDGDTPLTSGSSGLVQAVRVSILLAQGEWYLDQEAGTDWYGSILGRAFNEARARATISASILAADGVVSVDSLSLSLNRTTRTLTIIWSATFAFGDSVADTLAVQV
jgi:hypothetical protein